MITITATVPCGAPPAWAVWERRLLDVLNQAIEPYWEKYVRPDGRLIWRTSMGNTWQPRDGADDFYESFYNWPLLYLLGGHDQLLERSHIAWEGVTAQLDDLGMLKNEFDIGYDQFHISEGQLFFDYLCMADPTNPQLITRARRFAGLYLNEDPEAPNYDSEHQIIRAPHNGSGGPRWGYLESDPPIYPGAENMRRYGLPFQDVPGVRTYDDLHTQAGAEAMGAAMQSRMGRGDVATNLVATTIVTNAALLTGETKYRDWVQAYVTAWMQRAQENGGLLPDNVGLSGKVGEYVDGKWYGGLYGWTWPHGFYNVGAAAFVAAANAFILTQSPHFLDLPRTQLRILTERGSTQAANMAEMSLGQQWMGIFALLDAPATTFLIPYRYGDGGWFDFQPIAPRYPIGLWALSMTNEDAQMTDQLRNLSNYDWNRVVALRVKDDGEHEAPWYTFLHGENPDYPAAILAEAYEVVHWRLALIRADQEDVTQVHIHHWQLHNPITTEALVQLTLGAPQPNYYGGLLHCRLRYYDALQRRPGLPPDVAALVTQLEAEQTTVQLVNLGISTQSVIVQAGGFAEHRFQRVRFTRLASAYPGPYKEATFVPSVTTSWQEETCAGPYLQVDLPPASQITLELAMTLHVAPPTYASPWSVMGES